MAREDIQNFKVVCFSNDGQDSPVLEFLESLAVKNPELAKSCISDIKNLPLLHYTGTNIKQVKIKGIKSYYLKVKKSTNICRFVYQLKKPNIIVIYGFIKKSQKIDRRDEDSIYRYQTAFKNNPQAVSFDF